MHASMVCAYGSSPRLPVSVAALLTVLSFCGCSRRHYRERADRETYAVLDERTTETPWTLPDGFTIEPDPRSRLVVPGDPDDPQLPTPGPHLYAYELPELTADASTADETPVAHSAATTTATSSSSDTGAETVGLPVQPVPPSYWEAMPRQCLARMFEFASVRSEYERQYRTTVPDAERDASPRLPLDEIVTLALLNSREYQTAKERLYTAALAVTLQRFDFSTRFQPANGADVDYLHERVDGHSEQSVGIASGVGVDKMLATGGTLLARFANNVVLTFDGPNGWATDIGSELLFTLSQSLLQSDLQLEALVQTERNLVYAARDFARYRAQLFVSLAAQYYDLLRNYRSIEIESQNYFSLVRTYEQAKAEVSAHVKNAPNSVAVDQFEQSMLSGRSGLISTCNRLEQSLDDLKFAVGLPTETPINIDLAELETFTLGDEVEVAAERVRRWRGLVLDRRGRTHPDRGDVLNGGTFLIERLLEWLRLRARRDALTPDTAELEELLDEFRVDALRLEVARNRAELDKANDPTAGAPDILRYERTSDVVEALSRLASRQLDIGRRRGNDAEGLAEMTRSVDELDSRQEGQSERLATILLDPKQAGMAELLRDSGELATALGEVVDALTALTGVSVEAANEQEELRLTLEQIDRLVAITDGLLETASSGLPLVDIDEDDAMKTALVQRFDLMNERGRLADAWRAIKLTADELRSVLDLEASYSMRTRDNEAFNFSEENSTARVALAFDLPLNRQSQRNEFRRALIDYQAGLRDLMELEDGIKLDVRDGLRTLAETRTQYPISVTQAALAAEQVLSVRLQLALGSEGVRGTDLLDAQEASRRALIAVADARIRYIVERARLVFDLELMEIDDSGVWAPISDPTYQPQPNLVYPESAGPAYGDLPSFAWVSKAIRRLLEHPVPGAGRETAVATEDAKPPTTPGEETDP